MLQQIAIAIINQYNGDPTLKNSLTGGLYFQLAPQNVSSPYGVFTFPMISFEEIMGNADDNITTVQVQFSLYDDTQDGGATIASLVDDLDSAYNWQSLVASSYDCVKMQRISLSDLSYVDGWWQAVLQYEYSLQPS